MVYGNAFNGNPEAGAVQVSENGTTWYELAGSKYYDDNLTATGASQSNGKFADAYTGTSRNADITYTLNSADITAALTGEHGSITANPFTNAIAWWPTVDEYADSVIAAAHQDSNVTVSRTANQLTFGGVTAVQDSNTTAEYAFGYADVTPNGSPATYGDAVNPYTPYTSGKTGGDGFDLAWAVDISTGLPVNVTGKVFKYVRVYSAVLDNATFGETSTEVCGIFTTANKASASVGTTAAPTITGGKTGSTSAIISTADRGSQIITKGGSSYTLTATGNGNMFINGQRISSGDSISITPSKSGTLVQIIAQDGNAAPYITWLTIKK